MGTGISAFDEFSQQYAAQKKADDEAKHQAAVRSSVQTQRQQQMGGFLE